MHLGFDFWSIFSMVSLVTAIPVAIMILLEKRSPFKTIAWIMALILLPMFGVIFYLFFGQEYRKQKLFSRKGLKSLKQYRQLSFKQFRKVSQSIQDLDPKIQEKQTIIRLLLKNSNALLTTSNKIKILNNAQEAYPSIFKALKRAKHHIHLEYYIFSDDKIGNKLKDLLIEKQQQGVKVRIIVDDVGSWSLSKKYITELRRYGIEIFSFMEVRFPRLTSRANYRNHRKIVVVDGKVGFTGGINFADRYIEGTKQIGPWYDMHVRIEGDAVNCLQVVFAADWYFVTHKNLSGQTYFPIHDNNNGIPVQISASGPDSDWPSIAQAFFAAITGAKNRVYIVTPYLMPPLEIKFALKTAALSNVDIRIIIPKKSDAIIPNWSSFSYVEELLEAGVRVYFFQAGFIHSKYLIVDDIFCSIGSSNLDFRSLETNFEVNAFIYDEKTTTKLTKYFKKDLQNSHEIKLDEWKKRPWHAKLRESLAHLVSPML